MFNFNKPTEPGKQPSGAGASGTTQHNTGPNITTTSATPTASTSPLNNTSSTNGGTATQVVVAIRIRPFSKRELSKEATAPTSIARAVDDHSVLITDPTVDTLEEILQRQRPRDRLYTFDKVFSEAAGQVDLYQTAVRPIVLEPVLTQNMNSTVFAYGATGAGKTHTMLGSETSPGIIPLLMVDLFEKIQEIEKRGKQKESYNVSLSYLEIYNENIHDLLTGKGDVLDLRDDTTTGRVVVAGLTTVPVKSGPEVLDWLSKGSKNRITEATGVNEVSSRSHAVLQVFVEKTVKGKTPAENVTTLTKLSMIDLAGSERASQTNNRGIRMVEGASINRSLLALGNCINALVDDENLNVVPAVAKDLNAPSTPNNGPASTNNTNTTTTNNTNTNTNQPIPKKPKYVNYRDSKLTRLLKDSLQGNCKTVMIANISPASLSYEETLNTLKYASRARCIKSALIPQIIYRHNPYAIAKPAIRTQDTNGGPLPQRLQTRVLRRVGSAPLSGGIKPSASSIDVFGAANTAASNTNTNNTASQAITSSKRIAGIPPSVSAALDHDIAQHRLRISGMTGGSSRRGSASMRGPGHFSGDKKAFQDMVDSLRKLLLEQREMRLKVVEMDELIAEANADIEKKEHKMEVWQNMLRKNSGASLTDKSNNQQQQSPAMNKNQLAQNVSRTRTELEELSSQLRKYQNLKSGYLSDLKMYRERIRHAEQSLPSKLDRTSKQYIHLLVRAATLELHHQDLLLHQKLSSKIIHKRDETLSHMKEHVQVLEKITNRQRELIMEAMTSQMPPRDLLVLYEELKAVKMDVASHGNDADADDDNDYRNGNSKERDEDVYDSDEEGIESLTTLLSPTTTTVKGGSKRNDHKAIKSSKKVLENMLKAQSQTLEARRKSRTNLLQEVAVIERFATPAALDSGSNSGNQLLNTVLNHPQQSNGTTSSTGQQQQQSPQQQLIQDSPYRRQRKHTSQTASSTPTGGLSRSSSTSYMSNPSTISQPNPVRPLKQINTLPLIESRSSLNTSKSGTSMKAMMSNNTNSKDSKDMTSSFSRAQILEEEDLVGGKVGSFGRDGQVVSPQQQPSQQTSSSNTKTSIFQKLVSKKEKKDKEKEKEREKIKETKPEPSYTVSSPLSAPATKSSVPSTVASPTARNATNAGASTTTTTTISPSMKVSQRVALTSEQIYKVKPKGTTNAAASRKGSK